MKLAEREPLQRRFAELYVEKAAGLWVDHSELINGARSSIGREAIEESGYPCDSWMAAQTAQALARNPKINAWIRQLAADRLQTMPEEKRPLALLHLAKYGRLSMPDYETMANNLSITVDELKQHGGDAPSIVAYYHRTRVEIALNKRVEAMSAFLSAEEVAELRHLISEHELLRSEQTANHGYEIRKSIDSRLAVVQQKIGEFEDAAKDKAELVNLEPKVADGSIFDNRDDMTRAIVRGFDIEAIIEAKKTELVQRFGAELAPELDELLRKHKMYLRGRSWASMGLTQRPEFFTESAE